MGQFKTVKDRQKCETFIVAALHVRRNKKERMDVFIRGINDGAKFNYVISVYIYHRIVISVFVIFIPVNAVWQWISASPSTACKNLCYDITIEPKVPYCQ